MSQPDLFAEQERLRRAASDWIRANPDAFALFERFALEMAALKRRFGMKALTERVRWEVARSWEKDADGFKLNNIYTAPYARLLMANEPELAGFFVTRNHGADQDAEDA